MLLEDNLLRLFYYLNLVIVVRFSAGFLVGLIVGLLGGLSIRSSDYLLLKKWLLDKQALYD